jgi:hypothetical protein
VPGLAQVGHLGWKEAHMAASDSAQPIQGTLVAQEKSKLRKVLRRFDLDPA